MKQALKNLVTTTLKQFDIGIIRYSTLQRLREESQTLCRVNEDIELLLKIPNQHFLKLFQLIPKSKSQMGQDLFVLSELEFKRNGFFVEFGATNGVDLSNTFLLEKAFGWNGILAEPAKSWHNNLRNNRSSHIETDCVWRDSNSILTFNEVKYPGLSTVDSYSFTDFHQEKRKEGKKYDVKTISLIDLLAKYNAPKQIDFLSIDTEGSEYEILSNFDFDKYQFNVITCEHNFTPMREKIFLLLTQKGYVRKFQEYSKFDDWYVKAELS